MHNQEFRFKRFAIRQERCPMKVGTDGVLLGAWAAIGPNDRRILDIGTGTGVIALMAAQRTESPPEAGADSFGASADASGVRIVGVDTDDVSQARENAAASPWGGRVEFVRCPVQEYRPAERYDLILSNPPFFVDSLTCPDAGRTLARHAVSLPFDALRDAVVRLLAPGGRFAAVLPFAEGERFVSICRGRLDLRRRTDVRTTPRRPVKRVLLEFAAAAGSVSGPAAGSASGPVPGFRTGSDAVCGPVERSQLVIGTGEHECYTPEYRALTRDFYLKF